MDVKEVCPFGSECEEARDNILYRCKLYIKMNGKDGAGNDHDRWDCSFNWQPIVQSETSGFTRHVAASIHKLRNETVKRQDAALKEVKEVIDGTKTLTR